MGYEPGNAPYQQNKNTGEPQSGGSDNGAPPPR